MYVAVKGGEAAIEAATRLAERERRGDPEVPELLIRQIEEQLSLAVDRVMAEGSLYDPEIAALAIKQARGDLIEAIFLVRAHRTTLPRFGTSQPVDTAAMMVRRRISAAFKDLPGGQILGPTTDYSLRLIDSSLADENREAAADAAAPAAALPDDRPPDDRPADDAADEPGIGHALRFLEQEELVEKPEPGDLGAPPPDITRKPLSYPADRPERLQSLARGDEGFLLGLAYSTQRGFGYNHPFVGEIRMGDVVLEIVPEELGFPIAIGDITLTECDVISQYRADSGTPPTFTRGYALVFGHSERKAIAMALMDRALRARELGEEIGAPAQDEEFVLAHADNVEASGFVQHLKLPHYVDFQAELEMLRRLRSQVEPPDAGETGS